MTEIASMFDIPPSDLWTIDRSFIYSTIKFKPSCQIWRVRHSVKLNFSQARIIGEFADELGDRMACAPSTVLAVCLYLFLRAMDGGKRGKWTMQQCARFCMVSPTSVNRLVRKIRKEEAETIKRIARLAAQICPPNGAFSLL